MKTEEPTEEITCPKCSGDGVVIEMVEDTVCCRRPNEDGSCCGYGTLDFKPEQKQCDHCRATGKIPNH